MRKTTSFGNKIELKKYTLVQKTCKAFFFSPHFNALLLPMQKELFDLSKGRLVKHPTAADMPESFSHSFLLGKSAKTFMKVLKDNLRTK